MKPNIQGNKPSGIEDLSAELVGDPLLDPDDYFDDKVALDTGHAGPFKISQTIIKLPTASITALTDRAAALLCRIEATSGEYWEADANAALAIGLNKRQLVKRYREELIDGGWIFSSGKAYCGSHRLSLTDKSKQETRTIPSALLNDLQDDSGDVGLIRLAAHLSKLCNNAEARVTWSKLAKVLGRGVNSISSQMEVLRDRYRWVNFEKEGRWWRITPGPSMDAWKGRETEQASLTNKGHLTHSKGTRFLASLSLASPIGRLVPNRSATGSTSSLERLKTDQERAVIQQAHLDRAKSLAPKIVEAFSYAFVGDSSDDALKGLVSVLANEILDSIYTSDCEAVWQPVSLWLRLYNCAKVQHPLQHAGGIISLLRRCKEHGLIAAFPTNWLNGPMYWSADAEEKYTDRTSLATLRDRWIAELHELQADGGYSWDWSAENFDLHQAGSDVRHRYQNIVDSWGDIEVFWDYTNGTLCFQDLELDQDWGLH